MFRSSILPLLLFAFPLFLAAQPKLQLVDWASGFDRPVDIAHCGDSRIFVVEQDGVIWTLDSLGNKLDTFLSIDPRVNSTNNEQGLLGLAFHPDYANNGYFFVHYSQNSSGATRISRFSVNSDNPNEADPNSELPVFSTDQPFNNHNGGCIKFGPDGYLYIGLGDGGSGGDPQGNGQKKNTFLGKMLRIDVNNSSMAAPYTIPANNPFVGQSAYLPEIWSLGWRNPWRFSFDRLTGDMWIGDVGQVTREEVDFEPAGMGGRNYGWRCYEGTVSHNTSGCQPQNTYVGPVFDYDNNSMGCSMTGGFIYRGSLYPNLYGWYLNADYCSGRIWGTQQKPDGTFSTVALANLGDYEFSTFGEDYRGELYIGLLSSGKVQKITELCASFQVTASNIVSPVCYNSFSGIIQLTTANGTGNISYAWSNGQTDPLNVYLNPGTYTVTVTSGDGCTRVESYDIAQQGPGLPTMTANDTLICAGQTATLTASNLSIPNQLKWYRGVTLIQTTTSSEPEFSITVPPGIGYFVQAFDSACALSSDPLNIQVETVPQPEVLVSGDTLFSTPPCTNCQWLLNNQAIPDATGTLFVAQSSGTYALEVTSDNGCTAQSEDIAIVISETKMPAAVRSFKLSPNPTGGSMTLTMELAKTERFTLSLSDSSQRQIFMQTQQTDKLSMPIDLKSLPAGTYFLQVQLESGSFVRRVVKR